MNFLDLFAGIGGFRRALELAGHTCIGFCEIDKYARQTYKANFSTEGEWEGHDITTISNEEIRNIGQGPGTVDIICGGFPCQAFSIAGKRLGFDDTRGTLFFEICRFAKLLKPKILLLENVKGLLSHDNGRTFFTILDTLGQLGYDVEYQLLNSKNFGVPQNRERVFIIGHLRSAGGRKIFPIRRAAGKTLIQVMPGKDAYRVYAPQGTARTFKSEGGGGGAKTGLYLIDLSKQETKHETAPTVSSGLYINDSVEFARKPLENCSRCLKANKHDAGIFDGIRIRKLIPLECFRLQGFSDDFFFVARAAGLSDSQLYKQAGNSVTVNVVYNIAKRL